MSKRAKKSEPAELAGMTAAQKQRWWQQENARHDKKAEEVKRRLHTALTFPKFCPLRQCRRAKFCRGDIKACGQRFYPGIPEAMKAWISKYTGSRRDGLPHEEAVRLAEQHMTRYQEYAARLQAEPAAASVDIAEPAEPANAAGNLPPRIRAM